MKTPTSAAGTCTNNGQREIRPLNRPPSAVAITEQGELLLEDPSTAIAPTVVVAQDHRHRKRQTRDPAGQAEIPIGEISHEKNSVRPENLQEMLIRIAPGAMKITGNGNAQVRQSGCLGCDHPAPKRS